MGKLEICLLFVRKLVLHNTGIFLKTFLDLNIRETQKKYGNSKQQKPVNYALSSKLQHNQRATTK